MAVVVISGCYWFSMCVVHIIDNIVSFEEVYTTGENALTDQPTDRDKHSHTHKSEYHQLILILHLDNVS